jgi:hypothetical protein
MPVPVTLCMAAGPILTYHCVSLSGYNPRRCLAGCTQRSFCIWSIACMPRSSVPYAWHWLVTAASMLRHTSACATRGIWTDGRQISSIAHKPLSKPPSGVAISSKSRQCRRDTACAYSVHLLALPMVRCWSVGRPIDCMAKEPCDAAANYLPLNLTAHL